MRKTNTEDMCQQLKHKINAFKIPKSTYKIGQRMCSPAVTLKKSYIPGDFCTIIQSISSLAIIRWNGNKPLFYLF